VYADAEFDGIGMIDALEVENLSYLIRKSSDDRVDRFVADMDDDLAVKQAREMEKSIRDESITVTLTLVGPPRRRKKIRRWCS